MRRKEREIKEFSGIVEVLGECDVINIAMCSNNIPYVVPMNYGFIVKDGKVEIYLHCAMEGKKIDVLKDNPNVSFSTSSLIKIVKAEENHNWTSHYKSIIGSGKAEFIVDEEEKISGIHSIMLHSGYKGDAIYSEKVLSKTMIIKIRVDIITAKANV